MWFFCGRTLRIYSTVHKNLVCQCSKALLPRSREAKGNVTAHRLFHDDTLKTDFRRLCFSPDGLMLFAPSGILETSSSNNAATDPSDKTPADPSNKLKNATFVFLRDSYSEYEFFRILTPYEILNFLLNYDNILMPFINISDLLCTTQLEISTPSLFDVAPFYSRKATTQTKTKYLIYLTKLWLPLLLRVVCFFTIQSMFLLLVTLPIFTILAWQTYHGKFSIFACPLIFLLTITGIGF